MGYQYSKNEYLRAFVIGSCFFVFFPYFFAVSHFDKRKTNFDYIPYTFYAPVGLGLMNVLSLFIAKKFNLTKEQRFFAISLIAPTLVLCVITFFKAYNYTTSDWRSHIFKLYILYSFVFNFIIQFLDKMV